MNKKDPLFIRTLQWASDRGSVGFKMHELRAAVTKDEEEWKWVQRMMLGEINGDPPLISHLGSHHTEGGEYRYFMTGSGASALIDYMGLEQAREGGRQAMRVAIASILISILTAYFAYQQLKVAVVELQQVNAQAQIQIAWKPINQKLTLEEKESDPFTFDVIPTNIGMNDTAYWQVTTIFCNGVKVINHNQNWVESSMGPNSMYFKSTQPILHDKAIFDDKEDSIGQFTIVFPVKPMDFPASIPLAFVQTSGQQTVPIGEYIYWQIDSMASSSIEYDYKFPVIQDILKSGCISPISS
jgi:hypothetical protein